MQNVRQCACVSFGIGLSMILAPLSGADAQLIGTNNIANGAVTAPKIANSAVSGTKIANSAVTGTKIANSAVTGTKIANSAVTDSKLADNAVTNGKIVDGAVTGAKLAADAVTAEKIAAGAVASEEIADAAVTNVKIAADAVTGSKIAAGAVTASKIAVGAVTSDKIAAGAITAEDIAAGAVTADKLATDAVSADGIAPGAVTADEIAAGAVTADKIFPESVSTDKIASEAVTADKIAPGAVTEYGIAAGAVTAEKIYPESVFTDKIASEAVTADKIAAFGITPDRLAFYRNIVIVAPTGGDFTSPVDALNAMPWDETCASRYLVKIMPGVYDIGEGYVQMRPCVDIEGSGMHTTLIKGTNTLSANGSVPGVVNGASHAELRDIAVLSEGAAAGNTAVAVKAPNSSGMTISRISAWATGSNVSAGIAIVTKAFDLNPLDLEPVVIADSEAFAGDYGTAAAAIIFSGTPATETTAGTEGLLHAIVRNTVATAKGATSSAAIVFRNATATVIGGVADGERAIASDAGSGGSGGGGQVLGTLLRGNVLVKNNKEQQTPMTIANCSAASGTTLEVDNGTLVVTNSHLDHAAALLNSPTLALLNSSLGGGVNMASGVFSAVNSSVAGEVAVTGGIANCAGGVRSDTFATLGANCQP